MPRKPIITVLMSVYNEPLAWIKESIESILNQTFKDFEFIIVNDNPESNDLNKILKFYNKNFDQIILVNNKSNIGLTASLNIGLQRASGDYIARMDADDISSIFRLETQLNFIKNNKDFFLIGAGTQHIDQLGEIVHTPDTITDEKKLKKKLLSKNALCHSTIFFRNDGKIYYRNKFVYAQDYDFYLRLISLNKRMINIPTRLVKYRINPNATTYRNKAIQKLFAEKALQFYHQRINFGSDNYDSFDETKILSIDIKTTKNPIVLREEIINNFLFGNFKIVRQYCKKYFRYHGFFSKIIIYYILSYTGNKFINLLRRTKLFDQVSTMQLKK
jgi:glycosyltransferase involved in cell wall biosynthesis